MMTQLIFNHMIIRHSGTQAFRHSVEILFCLGSSEEGRYEYSVYLDNLVGYTLKVYCTM
jgi:hypothetical protein